ncbi:sigma-54-dependent Fis family transcriptional regulator [uncultured Slackia sp.]|uniref:sigma-54 interaction domain-containing protein n=1 Tax=uncultured Slackia sp. TaxID=665903 RepID=UPI0025E8F165|nr:sigma 54-interacting transcriptional regulator [uncultured Slackia sp.]
MYDRKRLAEAWRTFVTTGVVDEDVVRPEIARSWRRCRAAGVNPWSSYYPSIDEALLREKRKKYAHSLAANTPIMRVIMALLECNVSLMDQENFVFEFISPLSYYPRTFGTYVLEEEVGTGNATVVPYEKKPVRVEGFEQYRSIAQTYSGVSAPFIDANKKYFGALNFNDPFNPLPEYALDMCAMGVDLANELFSAGRSLNARLSTAEFFAPLANLMDEPVLILDLQGHVLLANSAMRSYVAGYEDFSYASQSIDAYLSKKTNASYLMREPIKDGQPLAISFKAPRKKGERTLYLVRRRSIDLGNGLTYVVCVFKESAKTAKVVVSRTSEPKVMGRATTRETVNYIGESDAWMKVDKLVRKIAPIKANVLILGETGTGKEGVARAIHAMSGRKGNFIAINCGAIPRDLFAAELFGYERGAFTGANESGAPGKIEAADGGTLFLDEIGEMPLDLQVGLLRVIQDQSVTRLGSTEARKFDVRFLAATNQDVRSLIDSQKFRADLYYRLSMVEIELPPLRRRDGDVRLLADYFNKDLSESLQLPYTPLPEDVMEALQNYTWRGNVRELRNIVERTLIMAGEGANVTLDDLPAHIANSVSTGSKFVGPALNMSGLAQASAKKTSTQGGAKNPSSDAHGEKGEKGDVDAFAPKGEANAERNRIIALVEEHGGNMSKAAKALGISRNTLYKRMEQLHLRVKVEVVIDE